MNPITAEEQAAFDHFGLRQYQIDAVMRVHEAYRNGARNVLLCAPTAAGKTRISACVVHLSSNRGKQAHFVVDRENLIDQTSRTFDQFKIAHGVVQQKHWRYRPYERAQVLSVQTVMRRGWPDQPKPDLVVVDEAHTVHAETKKRLTVGDTYGLGLTATPFTKGLGQIYDTLINVETTNRLIEQGALVPYRIFSPSQPDMTGVKVNAGEWEQAEATKRALQVVGDCVAEYIKHGNSQKFICSAITVDHAREIHRQFTAAGIQCVVYTSRETKEECDEIVAEFSKPDSYIRGLITVSKATKGFDVPDVGCVIMCRPLRKSLADHIQLLGRGLRTSPDTGKTECIVLDHSGNCERFWDDMNEFFETGALALSISAKTALLPTIVALTDALGDNASLKPVLMDFYNGVADVVKGAAVVLATFVVGAEQAGTAISMTATIANRVGALDFAGAAAAAKSGYAQLRQEGDAYSKFIDRLWSNTAPQTAGNHPKTGQRQIRYSTGNNSGHVDESGIDAQLTAQQQQQKLIEDSLKNHLDHLKSLRDQGLIDDETYLKDFHDQNQAALTQELSIAQQQLDIASGKKNKSAMEKYAGEVAQIQQKLAASDQQYTDDTAKLAKKRQVAIDAYADTLKQQLDTARSQAAVSVASIGMGDQEAQHYQQLISLQEDYNKKSSDLQKQLNTNQIDKTQYDAELQSLQSYYAQRVGIAKKSWADESAARANWVNGITAGAQNLANEVADVAGETKGVFSDVVNGMADVFANFVTTGKLSFSDFAKSVISDIAKIAAKTAESQLISGVLGYFNVGGAGAAISAFATGGVLSGPGSGTSDSMLIRASNGEGILTADTVKRLGGASAIDALNGGASVNHLDRFATGGVVGASSSVPASSSDGGAIVNLTVQTSDSGGGLTADDAKWLQGQLKSLVDARIAAKMKGQGGYAWQQKYGSVS